MRGSEEALLRGSELHCAWAPACIGPRYGKWATCLSKDSGAAGRPSMLPAMYGRSLSCAGRGPTAAGAGARGHLLRENKLYWQSRT